MTAPNVGEVSVEVLADAKALAKSLRAEIESAFKGLNFDKLIRDSVGTRPIRVSVEPDVKTDEIPAKVRETRTPKVPVELDPVLGAFQAEMRSQVQALARTVNAKIPIGADTAGLRAELGAQLAEVQRSVKVDVPTEPGSRAVYEAKLKAQLAEVSHRVKQSVPVDVDNGGGGGISSFLTSLSGSIPGVAALSSALSGVGSAMSSVGGSVPGVVSGIGTVASVIGALTAGAVAAPPALAALAGALAAIPAALSGAGAVVGTLFLGFKGISDAFKPKTGGGGGGSAGQSAAQQARQVAAASRQVESARRGIAAANRAYEASERSLAAAERGMATAQRNLVDAEQAVTKAQEQERLAQIAVGKARRDAANDLVDLNLQLKGSKLSEQEAALAVSDALRELNAVKLTGNIPDIQKADLAYQRAQLSLQDTTQSTKELQQQADDANKKGVEGSDKVQAALRSQADAADGVKKAQEGVLDAQNGIRDAADSLKSAQDGVKSAQDGIKAAMDSLKSAQDGLAQAQTKTAAGASAAAAQVTKLAPAAQSFVNAVKGLKPAFDNLRLDVQQRLFDGLDRTVTHLGDAWIPALRTTLGSYADTFNGFFKSLGASISTPKFISDIQAGAEGARQGLSQIGGALTKDLVPAFGDLSRAAGPFLSQVGGWIADAVSKFSHWVEKANKSGKLQEFFDRAATAFKEIGTTGTLVVQIVGDLIGIITGAQATSGKSSLDSFNDGLKNVHAWLQDPNNQKKIQDFIKDLQDLAGKFKSGADKVGDLIDKLHNFADSVDGIRGRVREFFKKLFGLDDDGQANSSGSQVGQSLGDGLLDGLQNKLGNVGGLIAGLLWSGPNSLVGRVKAGLGIRSPSTVFAEIGGSLIDGLIKGIGDKLGQLGTFVLSIPATVRNRLSDAKSWLHTHGQQAVGGLSTGIGSWLGNLRTTAGTMRTTVQNALSNSGSWLRTHGQQTVSGLGSGITSMFGNLRTWAGQARTWVQSALSNSASWLVTHGRNVVIGLWNGIAGLGGWLWSHVVSFAKTNVKNAFKNALGIASPSKVAEEIGGFVGVGLAQGLEGQQRRVSEAADVVAAAATPQIPDVTFGFGAGIDAALSASLQASSQQQVQVSWNTGATSDPLLRAFQNLINVQFRGNVQAAFTGA